MFLQVEQWSAVWGLQRGQQRGHGLDHSLYEVQSLQLGQQTLLSSATPVSTHLQAGDDYAFVMYGKQRPNEPRGRVAKLVVTVI